LDRRPNVLTCLHYMLDGAIGQCVCDQYPISRRGLRCQSANGSREPAVRFKAAPSEHFMDNATTSLLFWLSSRMHLIDATTGAFALLFSGDAGLWRIVWISLKTSVLGLLIATPFAVAGGYAIASHAFRGRRILIWLAQVALSMPTVLIGLLLYLSLSRHGPAGDLRWLFTQSGMVAGQVLIAMPVLIAFTLASVQAADPRLAETAITLGASRWRVMTTLLYEVRFGVMAAIINGFGRVISEVGCAMMVGGNIEGETRTITTAIALETSKGEFAQGIALGMVLIAIALVINAGLMLLQGDAHATRHIRTVQ
jgi:tungstate transport system permease protein